MTDQKSSSTTTTEAHEVKSVREQVEGMGVETEQANIVASDPKTHSTPRTQQNDLDNSPTSSTKGKDLPASWDAYADLQSPFACFAPRTTTWSYAQPSDQSAKEDSTNPPARALAPPPKQVSTAPAFSLTGQQTATNSLCPNKFPSGSDFFLKGKRNTSVADSSPELDEDSASQSKKPKLPPPVNSSASCPPSSSSSKRNHPLSPTSLRSAALEKFNSNPSLHTTSVQSSTVSTFLDVHPPSSKASSACADNGENEDSASSTIPSAIPPSEAQKASNNKPLGFSAFATSTGFGDSSAKPTIDWSDGRVSSPSVFDQQPPSSSKPSHPSQPESQQNPVSEWGGGQTGERKTHLALSAELGQEDKHEGFLATEVITGEENAELDKSVRCMKFTLGEDQSWRERGTGGLRLLRTKEEPYRYRLIMRADAVLRVLLNVPIFHGFSYRPTQDKFLTFASTVALEPSAGSGSGTTAPAENEGEPGKTQFQQYLCRFGKPEARQEIIDSIERCLKDLNQQQKQQSIPDNNQGNHEDPSSVVDASDLV
ncbi:uncharacterized protein PGTG_04156 [Puccinia graminis f. sp. tritici CRL 75-36-700-3]|uniref:RanBD1 domain-containing protein n=1 Tax=Puccinia graminis f. sp. tritici (strain CRL 75-36-700-3 / race SCCL) TaxID=418459 RepID=E3K1M5_PUCGT|nr:uncharacterized protein PGTG_04156 [Puccinia graminis f. sp. tritici CRL 75-36-700-3]EFP78200.1 hypothetical protein PGTG_04156 [Puccinia graminis f. sp. tritici CRL 75-36-700-3]